MKTIIVVIYVVFATIISYPKRIYNNIRYKNTKEGHDANFYMLKRIAIRILKILNINVEVKGNVDFKEDNLLYIGNHRSNFDSLILIAYMKKPIMFIGKSEIKMFPLIGKWFIDIGCLFLEREDIKKSMEVIKKGVNRIENGYSLVIFPEGGRTREKKVGEFKPGSLKLATKTNVNIVPITFIDSEDCYELHHKFKSANVKLIVGDAINLEEMQLKKTVEIANFLQDIIAKQYQSLD